MPTSLDVTLRLVLVSTWRAVTVTPGKAAPCSSAAFPRAVAVVVCARKSSGRAIANASHIPTQHGFLTARNASPARSCSEAMECQQCRAISASLETAEFSAVYAGLRGLRPVFALPDQ